MPIRLSDDGRDTDESEVQSAKASCPICVTVDGSETDLISVLPANAPAPTAVTVLPPTDDGTVT